MTSEEEQKAYREAIQNRQKLSWTRRLVLDFCQLLDQFVACYYILCGRSVIFNSRIWFKNEYDRDRGKFLKIDAIDEQQPELPRMNVVACDIHIVGDCGHAGCQPEALGIK